jgi:hypothetical protein
MSASQTLQPAGEPPVSGSIFYSRSRPPARKRAWIPSSWSGNFRLPIRIADRLKADSGHLRNRDAVFTLIVYLARHHAGPKTIARGTRTGFWIVREALAQSEKVNLTEDQVRGAIKAAIALGIIEPLLSPEEMRQPGRRANLPQLYRFTGDYAEMFKAVARRAHRLSDAVSDSVCFFKSPISNRANEVSVDSGDLSGVPSERRPLASSNLRHSVPAPRNPLQKSKPLSDEAIWLLVEKDLERVCGGKTKLYWTVFAHLTLEMQQEALRAERAEAGTGLATLQLALQKTS